MYARRCGPCCPRIQAAVANSVRAQEVQTALERAYADERARLRTLLLEAGDAPDGVFQSPVFGGGPMNPWLVLVGEAPGAQEVLAGKAFVGAAGEQFSAWLAQAGIRREDVFVTNTVKYRPVSYSARGMRNRTPRTAEIRAGLPLLRKELQLLQPACVATLGNVPLKAVCMLLGKSGMTIGGVHGKAMQLELEGMRAVWFPLYHPASIIYNRELEAVCGEDARTLGNLYALRQSGK